MSDGQQPKPIATDKEIFDLVYKSFTDYGERFMTRTIAVVGFQLIILGWLLTSEGPRSLLKDNLYLSVAATILFVVFALVWVPSISRVLRSHRQWYDKLTEIKFIRQDFYEPHLLPSWYLHASILTVWTLYALAIILIWSIY